MANAKPGIPATAVTPVPFERAVTQTLWGISFVGMGVGLAAADCLAGLLLTRLLGSSWPTILVGLGFLWLLLHPKAFGASHQRCAMTGLAVGVLALAMYYAVPLALGTPSSGGAYVADAAWQRALILTSSLVLPMAFASVFLASFALQDRAGRVLLVAGLAAAVVVQVVLWFWLNAALDTALAQALAVRGSQPLLDFPATWSRFGSLNAIPSAILLLALERLYWQLRRRHVPGASLVDV